MIILIEKNNISTAKDILEKAESEKCQIILPEDVVIAKSFNEKDSIETVKIDNIKNDYSIFDLGESTIEKISNLMANCKTVFWNGPLGFYEQEPFDNSTNIIGRTAAILTRSNLITSVVGGGDTVAALNKEDLPSFGLPTNTTYNIF